jgi:hypothetical protein
MEPEGSLPHSQELTTCPYPEPDQHHINTLANKMVTPTKNGGCFQRRLKERESEMIIHKVLSQYRVSEKDVPKYISFHREKKPCSPYDGWSLLKNMICNILLRSVLHFEKGIEIVKETKVSKEE